MAKLCKLDIENRSKWPDGFLRVVCKWAAKRAGINWRYSILFRSRQAMGFAGRGWDFGCNLRIARRAYHANEPHTLKDRRFQWSRPFEIWGSVEGLVYLLAHEMHHARDDRRPGNRGSAEEFRCNRAAEDAVKAWRVERLAVMGKVKAELRKDTQRKVKAKERKQATKTPDAKLARVQANLVNWERKLRYAQNKVKTYKRKMKYYEKRVAACRT